MSKITDKQIIIFSVLLFSFIYITVHTNIFSNFFDVLRPFINGFILAYLTNLLATKVEKKILLKSSKGNLYSKGTRGQTPSKITRGKPPSKGARGLSILIIYLLFAGMITVLLVYIIPILIQNIQLLTLRLPEYLGESQLPTLTSFFESFSLLDLTTRYGADLLGFTSYARAATSSVVNGILTLVVSVYVLMTKEGIFNFSNRLGKMIIPNRIDAVQRMLKKSHLVFQQFLLAQLFASMILGILAGIVLSLLGINYAILIGAIIGLSNIIPLFGAVIGVIISTLIIFLSNPAMLAWASFVFLLLLQQIDATIITPKLMGNVLNLNPIIVILAMIFGTHYFGFVGILFAVPVTVIIREIVKEKLRES